MKQNIKDWVDKTTPYEMEVDDSTLVPSGSREKQRHRLRICGLYFIKYGLVLYGKWTDFIASVCCIVCQNNTSLLRNQHITNP
jgi:hypothetical protein